MRREFWERFPCHRLQRKPLVSDADMRHGTCVAHVPGSMSGTPTRGEEVFQSSSAIYVVCAQYTCSLSHRVNTWCAIYLYQICKWICIFDLSQPWDDTRRRNTVPSLQWICDTRIPCIISHGSILIRSEYFISNASRLHVFCRVFLSQKPLLSILMDRLSRANGLCRFYL